MPAAPPTLRHDSAPPTSAWRHALLALAAALLAACGNENPPHDRAVALAPPGAEALADAMVSGGASARRVADYELSEERVEAWFEADAELSELTDDDPEVAERLERESARRGERDPIRRGVARLEAVPEARDALDDAGVTPYDYVMTGLALHQALLAAEPASPPALRRLAARNAAFVRRHADVLARYAERRPRYMASGEPDEEDDAPSLGPDDTLAWLDTVSAAGDLAPEPDLAVDTALAVPATLPAPGDTVAPLIPAPVLPATLPDTSAQLRPVVPDTLGAPRPAPVPPPAW